MRNFRTAAVAAATALTVAVSGTAVASAENANSSSSSIGSSSSQWGKDLGAWTEGEDGKPVIEDDNQVSGVDLFGSEKADDEDLPDWAVLFRDTTIAGGVLSLVGGLIAAYNYAVFNGILPGHIFDGLFK
ncbi:hypothetical protein [Corynebacterium sp. HMSC04H06]|uniref:hypothetical protein n=1 Tax=Corynebacterium sp. HMSC04H06 TaxID=1581050 RepID=UPI0008A58004|nr:hypothetical protein [Corynebacterium sp. HMSC04H06]OFS19832.1 hypothetical protein HMPREF3067_09355 [Corynebacterium sp. HMSC04H06]